MMPSRFTAWSPDLVRGLSPFVPALSILLLLLLQAVPWHVPALVILMPPLYLMGFFVWCVYRPDLFTRSAAFGIGILHAVVLASPVGFMALLLLLLQHFILRQRQVFASGSFFMLWWGYALAALVVALLQTLILPLWGHGWPDLSLLLLQYVLGLAVFPLVAGLLMQLQRRWMPLPTDSRRFMS